MLLNPLLKTELLKPIIYWPNDQYIFTGVNVKPNIF